MNNEDELEAAPLNPLTHVEAKFNVNLLPKWGGKDSKNPQIKWYILRKYVYQYICIYIYIYILHVMINDIYIMLYY